MPKKVKLRGADLIKMHQGEDLEEDLEEVAEPAPDSLDAQETAPVEEIATATREVPPSDGEQAGTESAETAGDQLAQPASVPVPADEEPADESDAPAASAEPVTEEGAPEAGEWHEQTPPAGQPGQFWDPTGAPLLPSGWATRSLEPIVDAERRGMERIRGSILLPDAVYDACFDWLWEMKQQGSRHTFYHIAEVAMEMIPPDDEGLRRLLDEVPAVYYAPMSTNSHIASLFQATNEQTRALPYRLKKMGFRQHARIIHTALIARVLTDLTGWTWPEEA